MIYIIGFGCSIVSFILFSVATGCGVQLASGFANTLFSASGILFPLTIGVLMQIEKKEIKNANFRKKLDSDLSGIKTRTVIIMVIVFVLFIGFFLTKELFIDWRFFRFSMGNFCLSGLVALFFCQIYIFNQIYRAKVVLENTIFEEKERMGQD